MENKTLTLTNMEDAIVPEKTQYCLHHYELDSRIDKTEKVQADLAAKWDRMQGWLIGLMASSLVTLLFVLVGLLKK